MEAVSQKWLSNVGFDDHDVTEFVSTGVSRHPVVGLLRSCRTSRVTLSDVANILSCLTAANRTSFSTLRALAEGLYAAIDPREPWMSGYKLARDIRKRLDIGMNGIVDMDGILQSMGIQVVDVSLADRTIRGACVGSARFQPAIFINIQCDDASGPSGRLTTLAHELCHLLFDRSRMRGLGRFEGPIGDTDRLVEMRANAFAIELLVPMDELLDENREVLGDDELRTKSVERGVSMHALTWHAENLRKLRSA